MSMEITESKYEWQLGEYLARTYVGEYCPFFNAT